MIYTLLHSMYYSALCKNERDVLALFKKSATQILQNLSLSVCLYVCVSEFLRSSQTMDTRGFEMVFGCDKERKKPCNRHFIHWGCKFINIIDVDLFVMMYESVLTPLICVFIKPVERKRRWSAAVMLVWVLTSKLFSL